MVVATICSLPGLGFVDLAHLHLCQPVSQGVVRDCGLQECGCLPLTRASGPGPGWSSDPIIPTQRPCPTHAPARPSRGGREYVAKGLAVGRSSAFCLLAQDQYTDISTGQGYSECPEECPCPESGPRGAASTKV